VANRRPSASRAFAVLLSPCAGETGVIPSFPVSPEEEEEEEVEVVVEVEELDMVIYNMNFWRKFQREILMVLRIARIV